MAYITQTDLENAVGGNAGLRRIMRQTPAATLDTARIASAIQYAESTIDKYAVGSPGYPWTTVPDACVQNAVALAIYRLYYLSWPSNNIGEAVTKAHDDALDELKALKEGDSTWVLSETPAKQNLSKVFAYLPGDTPSDDNRRRARFGSLRDLF